MAKDSNLFVLEIQPMKVNDMARTINPTVTAQPVCRECGRTKTSCTCAEPDPLYAAAVIAEGIIIDISAPSSPDVGGGSNSDGFGGGDFGGGGSSGDW